MSIEDVEVVIIVAEPGNPLPGQGHVVTGDPVANLEAVCRDAYGVLESPVGTWQAAVPWQLNLIYPGMSLAGQVRRVWITESSRSPRTMPQPGPRRRESLSGLVGDAVRAPGGARVRNLELRRAISKPTGTRSLTRFSTERHMRLAGQANTDGRAHGSDRASA
jgi:hypothetical protein